MFFQTYVQWSIDIVPTNVAPMKGYEKNSLFLKYLDVLPSSMYHHK